jgi:adenylate kinase
LLFGPPGSGKGTQSRLLSAWLGVPALSTGEMLRSEVAEGSELGRAVSELLANGQFVSDDMVNQIVTRKLQQPDYERGCLLDGYPRTVQQAEYLEDFLKQIGKPRAHVVHLDVPSEVILGRLTSRIHCPNCKRTYNVSASELRWTTECGECGALLERRADDREDVIRQRLLTYDNVTGPILALYTGEHYHKIDGNLSPDEVFQHIQDSLRPRLNGLQPKY